MNVWLVEKRMEQNGLLTKKTVHVASTEEKAIEWIQDRPSEKAPNSWYALFEKGIDRTDNQHLDVQFLNSEGEVIDSQPIDRGANERRAEQGGFSIG
jgi:hypothetical protein